MRRAEMLLLKSLAETLMANRDNRHDDLQATMRLAHLSSPEMILYMVNRVLELEESIERIAAVLQKLSADEPMPLEETPPEPAFEPVAGGAAFKVEHDHSVPYLGISRRLARLGSCRRTSAIRAGSRSAKPSPAVAPPRSSTTSPHGSTTRLWP